MDREHSCCFTGHRPERLPWKNREEDPRCLFLKRQIRTCVEQAWADGYRHFICGVAQGADFYFAEAVLALREEHPEITLEAARPCESQADGWEEEVRRRYFSILERCNYETMVQHRYDRGCMMRRNRYMVDRASRILAVYDGTAKGGTAQTLAYAMGKGLEVCILDWDKGDTM